MFTCAADGTVRSFDLGGMLDLPPGYIVRNMNHAEDVNGRVVGRHEMSMVHGFEVRATLINC